MKRWVVTVAVAATLAAASGRAQAADAPSTLGIGIGYVKSKSVDATIFISGDFRFHLGQHFAFAPEVSYWKKSGQDVLVEASVSDLEFGVNMLGVMRPATKVEVFLGGGGGVHQIGGSVALGALQSSQTLTKGGVDAMGGVTLEVADDLGFFLSGRYDWVLGLGGADSARLDQYKFFGGFRLRF